MNQNGRKLRQRILALLASGDYQPLDKIEIARALGVQSNQRVTVRKELRELERSGEIARIRKTRYILPPAADLVAGTIQIHQAATDFSRRKNRARLICSSRPITPAQL